MMKCYCYLLPTVTYKYIHIDNNNNKGRKNMGEISISKFRFSELLKIIFYLEKPMKIEPKCEHNKHFIFIFSTLKPP